MVKSALIYVKGLSVYGCPEKCISVESTLKLLTFLAFSVDYPWPIGLRLAKLFT